MRLKASAKTVGDAREATTDGKQMGCGNLPLDLWPCPDGGMPPGTKFEDIPEAIKNYVIIRAANVFAGRAVGSAEAVKFGQQEETLARAGALEYETQQGDYNIFGNSQGLNTYNSYRPRSTVYRY